VFLQIQDANDNAPEFQEQTFHFTVREDAAPGSLISPVLATDKDSDVFGQIRYFLKGFGATKFRTDIIDGGIYIGPMALGKLW